MESIIISLGVILAALISGIFVVINFIVAKDQKTSEFRQNWIDSLRKDVAEYISINEVMFSNLIHSANSNKISNDELNTFFENNLSYFTQRNNTRNSIYLRVNPTDDKEIITAVQEIEKYWEGKKNFEITEISKDINRLIKLMQTLLKKEWKRVKSGEISYKTLKYFFIVSVIALAIYIILLLSGTLSLPILLSRFTT